MKLHSKLEYEGPPWLGLGAGPNGTISHPNRICDADYTIDTTIKTPSTIFEGRLELRRSYNSNQLNLTKFARVLSII